MLDYRYIIRTVDNRKYLFQCGNQQLDQVYRGVMSRESVGVTKWAKDKIVIINTKHIVSIEKW